MTSHFIHSPRPPSPDRLTVSAQPNHSAPSSTTNSNFQAVNALPRLSKIDQELSEPYFPPLPPIEPFETLAYELGLSLFEDKSTEEKKPNASNPEHC